MAKRKKAKKAPASAKVVRLVKLPKAGELRGHGLVILETLKKGGKRMTVPDLIARLEGKLTTKNALGLRDVWHMTRPRLLALGFIEEVGGAK